MRQNSRRPAPKEASTAQLLSTAEMQARIEVLETELREARDQQTATAEVLQVINASPGDLAPVFDAMLEKATRLCAASFGILLNYDGQQFRHAALRRIPPAYAEFMRDYPPIYGPDSAPGRLVAGEDLVHVLDMTDTDLYRSGEPNRQAIADLAGARTVVAVPLRKDDVLMGAIVVFRQEVRAFSEKQLSLLQNFAAQAVIAMENARLITETREALEQQTATAEVLGIINSSPGDLAPVFDAMLEGALASCGGTYGALLTFDGERLHPVASRGHVGFDAWHRAHGPIRPAPGSQIARIIGGEDAVQITDIANDQVYREGSPPRRAMVDIGGFQTLLCVALRKDNTLLGVLQMYRQEARPFTEKQIAVLENFAAQAVIAMENARLIIETREALEQQTATAEVLGVINSSPGDLAPVFDAMLEKALRLCEAAFGFLWTWDGEQMHRQAFRGVPDELLEQLREPLKPPPGSIPERIINGERVVSDLDVLEGPRRSTILARWGARSCVGVALRKDNKLLGGITIYRGEVRPFSEKQLALLQNFAVQAVIAMENARLITETREALEQQTATAEVLAIINSSPEDLTPVFHTMLDMGARLCDARFGLLGMYDGDGFRGVASVGFPADAALGLSRVRHPPSGTTLAIAQETKRAVQLADISVEPAFAPVLASNPSLRDARTNLVVPMLKEDQLIGAIIVFREVIKPFTEKQIGLLQNFAAQAVIAIENARLINETREALEQQTATAEVLGVINSSPGDLAPVFDAMLEKAMHLCEAAFGQLATYDGGRFHTATTRGVPADFAEYRRNNPPDYGPGTTPARILAGERVICTEDLKAEPAYQSGEPNRKALVDLGGARSAVIVALRKEDEVVGFIQIYRQEVRPFSAKQIALLENFAAQAVIAMENARLLDEIRQRQAELRVTFDNMGDGVVMFDENRRLAAWNRNFQEMLDLPDNILADRPSYADYLRLLAERGEFGSDDLESELKRRLENTEQEFRTERTRPDGRVIEVRRNAVPDGGFVLIYSDITERKRAEAEIRAARDAAEVALKELQTTQASLVHAQKMAALGQLTAGIAHEIKNPLNFVNNFAGLSVELLDELKEETAPAIAALGEDKQAAIDETIEMITSNLEKIAEHGKRADGIVKSMLDHSRGGTGDSRPVDLNGLIDEALNLAYHGARAQDQSFNITMERDLDRDLAPIDVVPQDMTRVFLNLFSNGFYAASKREREAADGFRPVLKVRTREVGDEIEIRVRDNGIGIAPEIRDKLFQPFVTTKPTGEGTGLGLSISYDIVTQQHGGSITVESERGEYTEFTVRLPRRRHSAAPGRAA